MANSGSISAQEVRFQLVHAVRGRTRMRVEPPYDVDVLAREIERFFRERPGVEEIRVNRDCQSIVVTYDPEVLGADDLLALDGADPEPSNGEGWLGWARDRLDEATQRIDGLALDASAAAGTVLESASRSARELLGSRWLGWLPLWRRNA